MLRLVDGGITAPRLPLLATTGEDVAFAAAFLGGGGREALDAFVREHAATVLAMVRRYARAPHDARDLAVESFRRTLLAARWTLRRDPERAVPFRGWLLRSTLHVARTHLRREVFLAGAPHEQLGRWDAPHRSAWAHEPDAARETRVRGLVLRLPPRVREVLTLRLDPGLPLAEIARILRITERAAVLNFHAAVDRLRAACGGAAAQPCSSWEVLLSARVAGALEGAEVARVEGHLARCAACRGALDAAAVALQIAALRPAAPADSVLAEELPARVATVLARDGRLVSPRRVAIAVAVAVSTLAATAALLLALG